MDDLQADASLQAAATEPENGVDRLIGKPLREVERFYMERALELNKGNREKAAKMLGIGERTLYRNIDEWQLQDKIKSALDDAGGDLAKAAKTLDMTTDALEKKVKKLGQRADDE